MQESTSEDITCKEASSAVRAAKSSLQGTVKLSIYRGCRYEHGQTKALSGSADTAEAMAAFGEKRDPNFD